MARPATALIVEDEAHVRVFLRLTLKELGIEQVWEADDGEKGLLMVKEHHPELVMLDLNLPIMSGVEVMTQLAEFHPNIPVIIMSSQRAKQTVVECQKLGAIAYVLKDASKREILTMLREAIESLEDGDPPDAA